MLGQFSVEWVAIVAALVVLSYNDEAWLHLDQLESMCEHHADVVTLAFDSARYVGARIGIHNPAGVKVGSVSHLTNREYVVVAGPVDLVRRTTATFAASRAGVSARA